jgi:hypothetical protein
VVFVFGGKFWLSSNQNKINKNPVQHGVKDFCGKNAPFFKFFGVENFHI